MCCITTPMIISISTLMMVCLDTNIFCWVQRYHICNMTNKKTFILIFNIINTVLQIRMVIMRLTCMEVMILVILYIIQETLWHYVLMAIIQIQDFNWSIIKLIQVNKTHSIFPRNSLNGSCTFFSTNSSSGNLYCC